MRIISWIVLFACSFAAPATVSRAARASNGSPAVGPQYDTTHVYVAPAEVDAFVQSVLATFGGHSTKPVVVTVTPTPSSTRSQLLLTPFGAFSVFAFRTPEPYPFGLERTGYLVRNLDTAVAEARAAGAAVLVDVFPDAIGRDAIIEWPGGVNMQLYWHTKPSSNPALQMVPENRVYVPREVADIFVHDFIRFAGGAVVSDDAQAPGMEIGRPDITYRRIRITSPFGRMAVLVTDGHLPFPYGRETTGYAVPDLAATLAKARAAGATVLAGPAASTGRQWAMVAFPGGYIAEIHAGP
jgi:hypothetical protein